MISVSFICFKDELTSELLFEGVVWIKTASNLNKREIRISFRRMNILIYVTCLVVILNLPQ